MPVQFHSKLPVVDAKYGKEIEKARKELRYLIFSKECAPIMLRLAFHDAGTYCKRTQTGGPNGSIRKPEEFEQSCNKGLKTAIDFCEEIKLKHPMISYADIYQLAGVVAVEITGGPTIEFVPGRKDSDKWTEDGRLPDDRDGTSQLKVKFKRMGLGEQDIVVLAEAHTLLRTHAGRTDYDTPWISKPPRFDNSYFKELQRKQSEGLLELPSDRSLMANYGHSLFVDMYAKNEDLFFQHYAISHRNLSELGFIPRPGFAFFYKKEESNVMAKSIIGAIISASIIIVWGRIKAK
ncbi:hypothetical protein L1887_12541 [Cichorium endivia]|nr:hypothetical protein L1887_12541 [Cichorium endivia]